MVEEILNTFQEIGATLGFASNGIAWAAIGCVLASLLCVIYGLIQWNRGERRSRRRRVTKGKRPRRRR